MGRLGNGELSQSSRAIKWRANKAVKNAAIALEKKGATPLIIEGETIMADKEMPKPSTEQVGILTPPPGPVGPETVEEQRYHCNNCQGTVHRGNKVCGVCEQRLDWAGL